MSCPGNSDTGDSAADDLEAAPIRLRGQLFCRHSLQTRSGLAGLLVPTALIEDLPESLDLGRRTPLAPGKINLNVAFARRQRVDTQPLAFGEGRQNAARHH